jgi:hypothetical protein
MAWGYVAAAVATVFIADQQQTARDARGRQEQTQRQAMESAQRTADQADQAFNAANRKKPNVQGIMDGIALSAQGGQSGTMLTGPMGIDASKLTLGRNTLLGQ